ncbi:MAG: hypothetical protein QG574_70 [Cyanobacteriota bacterium erpe_2018_sw_21hr_WHONDRS-SW48-000092_B_bin.40]|nr:hypothetical protein [Cyanobacteriota bacterium erpe_2018_sw_21hr_WHONDRS-SW48-000092_B_bin.40]
MTKDRANDSDDKAKKAEAPSASDRVSESGVVDSGDKARRLRAQLAAYGDQDASATHIGKSAAEIAQLKASGLAAKFELVDDEKSATLLKGSVRETVQAKNNIRPEEPTFQQKLSNFVQSAEARLLDPAGQQKYFQGQIDKIQGIGDGLNIAKEEMKDAGRKAWEALQDGSVAKFLSQPNAINDPLFHAIGKSFDAMKRDPQTVNHVLERLGHEMIAANDKYNRLSEHDKGVEIGKAMFFFVNPEGSTEGGATALKVADRVATHVDAAAIKAIDHTVEASTKMASRAAEAAQEAKQFIAESMQHGQMKPALAGGPGNAFEPPISQPKPKFNDHTMAMSSDGIGEGAAGDGLANAGKAGERAAGDAVAGDAVAGSGASGRPKQVFYMPIARNEILKEPEIILLGGVERLERMSAEELAANGLRTFEMPELILERDGEKFIATVKGHPDAYFEATTENPGEVTIRQIFKATLPRGTGNLLMSEGLRLHNLSPTKKLVVDRIVNDSTLAAYNLGDPPERSLLAKCAIKALKSLNIQPIDFKYEEVRRAVRIIIETSR